VHDGSGTFKFALLCDLILSVRTFQVIHELNIREPEGEVQAYAEVLVEPSAPDDLGKGYHA
jgi:hypothetical protein